MQPRKGQLPLASEEGLSDYDFSRVDIQRDDRLNLQKPNCHPEIYKNEGTAACVDYGLANPDATEHLGVAIEPYTSVKKRTLQ